jgi:hypothetical protein
MEVFLKDTKTRVVLGGLGLALVLLAVATQYQAAHPRPSRPMAPEMVLLCTISSAYGAAFALTVGLWGRFPEWSHAFIPRFLREDFVRRYKAYAGLRNIRERLSGLYGATARLSSTVVQPSGVCASVRIPRELHTQRHGFMETTQSHGNKPAI